MSDIHGGMAETTLDAYSSANCTTCPWKLSGMDDGDTPDVIRRDSGMIEREARQHAEHAGHQVSMIVTKHVMFDYRVERGT